MEQSKQDKQSDQEKLAREVFAAKAMKEHKLQARMEVEEHAFTRRAGVAMNVFTALIGSGVNDDDAARRCFPVADVYLKVHTVEETKAKVSYNELREEYQKLKNA